MKHEPFKFKLVTNAGNDISYYHGRFKTMEDAEQHLLQFLASNEEGNRQDYRIEPIEEEKWTPNH